MNRRDFVKAFAAIGAFASARTRTALAATESPVPASDSWSGWQSGHFQIHAIYTGVAESIFLVYPDGTSLLIDCGDHPAHTRGKLAVPILPDLTKHSGARIAEYVRKVNPRGSEVDYFLLTHYHSDHAGSYGYHAGFSPDFKYVKSGLGEAIETLSFGKVVDRAWPTFDDPLPVSENADGRLLANLKEVYAELRRRGTEIERFRLEAGSDQLRPLHGGADAFSVRALSANGRLLAPDGSVVDLYAAEKAAGRLSKVNENMMSIGLRFDFGCFGFYTAGDFSDGGGRREARMAEVCGRVDVAKINHHGHHSMPEGLVRALGARVYLACIWDQLHVTRDAMRRIAAGSAPNRPLLAPGVFTEERRREDADEKWKQDVAQETFGGAHVVVDVPPGGAEYTVSFISPCDDDLRILGERRFRSVKS